MKASCNAALSRHASEYGRERIWAGATVLAVGYGFTLALSRAWVTDDAFISFRYADNLARGLGLVFNAGERVEGYTNFLWTVWCAVGIRLGADVECWSIVWGLVFYAGSILLLAVHQRRWQLGGTGASSALPIAALLAAVCRDWQIYATSGLETSLFTFLIIAGYVLLVEGEHCAAAAFVLSLAALTRPDGLIFAAMAGLYVLAIGRPFARSVVSFGVPCLLILVPFEIWRLSYYGDWVPNTFYAKSVDLAWYSQGWLYIRLFFLKYWVFLLGLPLIGTVVWKRARGTHACASAHPRRDWQRCALASAYAVVYTLCVMRVGGDFMYARVLIPSVPFFLIVLEYGLIELTAQRPALQFIGAAMLCAALMLTPTPFKGDEDIQGIVDEWAWYTPEYTDELKAAGGALRRFFEGIPVSVAFFGSEARVVYYAKPAVAIESETGLTDRFVAHQKLSQRGRIGHEKGAPASYLIEQRHVHFIFALNSPKALQFRETIPIVLIDFQGLKGLILHWDPEVLQRLKERGAVFPDFPSWLDQQISQLDRVPSDTVRQQYAMFKRFYFDYVPDMNRQRPFIERLAVVGH